MSQTLQIPQLNLFSSSRNHKSPTRPYHQRSNHKSKNNITLNENYLSRQYKPRILDYPPPILDPVVPVPQIYQPIMRRPIPDLYPAISHEYIRAPSTYLQYAEDYLLGYPLSIIPSSTTGRFYNSKTASHQIKKQVNKCICEQESHQHHNSLTKNVYITNKRNKEQNKMKENLKPQTQINIHPPPTDGNEPSISKNPYVNQNVKREEKEERKEGHKGLAIIEQSKSLLIEDAKKQGTKRKEQGIQTDEINSKTTVIRRSQMETLDNQSFMRLQQANFQNFHQIRIELEHAIEYDPELEDLKQIKQIYELEAAQKISELDRILEKGKRLKPRTGIFRELC